MNTILKMSLKIFFNEKKVFKSKLALYINKLENTNADVYLNTKYYHKNINLYCLA